MKICLVAHFAYGAISGGSAGHAGGVERQTSLMARWLAARGHEVSLLTWREGPPGDETLHGVRVVKMCGQTEGVPGFRFFHPRWTSLIRALRRADADLYYHNCAECHTGQIALWCRRHGRRFVFSTANDEECRKKPLVVPTERDRILYRYGLRNADRVIVQTELQQALLRENYGLGSIVLPMPCPGPGSAGYEEHAPPASADLSILWVGRIIPPKRLEMLLEVARLLPSVTFTVAGALGSDVEYAARMEQRLQQSPNVRWLGQVAREDMPELYQSSDVLCSTSVFEGFPNVYLEAWSFGLPIVSTFDPDGLIRRRNLGSTVADAAEMASALKGFAAAPESWRACSQNARRYYLENHTVDAVMTHFESLFQEVLTSHGPQPQQSLSA